MDTSKEYIKIYNEINQCQFGQHIWIDTGSAVKIWSDNKTNSEPPDDCQTLRERKCLLCGQKGGEDWI